MSLKKLMIVLSLLVLTALGISIVGAQDATPQSPMTAERRGIRAVIDAVVEETGLEAREIMQQVAQGSTLAEIIEANGGDVQSVIDQTVTVLTDEINQAVTDGKLTQERADRLLSNVQDLVTRAINGELFPNRLDNGPIRRASQTILVRAAAEETGLRPAQILEQLAQGQTLGEVITANNGSVDNVVNAAVTAATEQINAAVASGRLGQEQADELISSLPDLYTAAVNGEWRQRAAQVAVSLAVVRFAAEQTGLEPREIIQQIHDGKSLADVLTEHGIDVNTFIDAAVGQAQERLNTAVQNGRLTQEQADQRLEEFRARLTERINQAGAPAAEATPA